jgi:uncharacterized coiled-coil protein SlyX
MSDAKLTHFEELITHQERQIHDLSDIVVQQGKDIDLLKRQILHLKGKIEAVEQGGGQNPEAGLSATEIAALNKPPHY